MARAIFTIGGDLPYQDRVLALDLFYWKIVEAGERLSAPRRRSPAEEQFLFLHVLRDLHDRAERQLENLRRGQPSRFDRPDLRSIEKTLSFRNQDEPAANVIFYPAVRSTFERSLLHELTDSPLLELASGSLALKASGARPYEALHIQSVNPLKISAAVKGTLGIVGVVLLALQVANQLDTHSDGEAVRQACATISNEYAEELRQAKIRESQLTALHEAFSECLGSELFNTTPISVEIGKTE